jgi:hypothetical protein
VTVVALTIPELRQACYVGIDRFVRAVADNRRPAHGVAHQDVAAHILGAQGERVIAKATGCYWPGDLGHPDRGDPDVGDWHVRTTSDPVRRLIVHKGDDPDGRFVHVAITRLPHFMIVGWCYARDVMDERWWVDPTGGERWAYFVPREALRPWPSNQGDLA